MYRRLALMTVMFLTVPAAMAQEETLPADLQAVLEAASQTGQQRDVTDAIRLLSLTQDDEVVYRAASELGYANAAILVLGNPVDLEETTTVESHAPAITPSNEETSDQTDRNWTNAPAGVVQAIAHGQSELWTGKIRLGLRFDSGNSERQDYNAGLEVERALAGWGFEGALNYSYSESDGTVGTDHIDANARAERELGERWTAFINGNYDQDALSGFDWTGFLGAGFGYRVIDGDSTSLIFRASPGVRIIEPVNMDQETREALELAADFNTNFTDTLSFKSETDFLITDQSRADQRFTLSSALGELWALEFRVHYRYEFDPEPGFENEDTRTDISITRDF